MPAEFVALIKSVCAKLVGAKTIDPDLVNGSFWSSLPSKFRSRKNYNKRMNALPPKSAENTAATETNAETAPAKKAPPVRLGSVAAAKIGKANFERKLSASKVKPTTSTKAAKTVKPPTKASATKASVPKAKASSNLIEKKKSLFNQFLHIGGITYKLLHTKG